MFVSIRFLAGDDCSRAYDLYVTGILHADCNTVAHVLGKIVEKKIYIFKYFNLQFNIQGFLGQHICC